MGYMTGKIVLGIYLVNKFGVDGSQVINCQL